MSRKRSAQGTPEPPEPPEIERRLSFHRLQLVGVPLIMLVPLLALFGLFGVNTGQASDTAEGLRLEVRYPSKFRYKMIGSLQIEVGNETAAALESVRVSVERDYVESFSSVSFTPSLSEITEMAYVIELPPIPAGGVRVVSVDIQAEEYWLHHGRVEISGGGRTIGVDVSTWTLP